MRKIREVLRLSAGGLSKRKIAVSLGISPTAAGDCIRRARQAGLWWPLLEELDDTGLEARLYPPPPKSARDRRPQPDWPSIHRELRPEERDAATALGGASRRLSRRLRIQPVL